MELKNHLSNARELICNLQIKVDKLQMNEQRKEWMQETVDAFADINAECEAERKEEEEYQQTLTKHK